MSAVLRQLFFRPRTGSYATSPAALLFRRYSSDNSPGCYALGKFGLMKFEREKFIPIEEFMRVNSVLEKAPTDRLISPLTMFKHRPYFTSESAKEWIRSGFLQVHLAKQLKLSVTGAFVEGNVGIIEGINMIAFLKLDTSPSSSSSSIPEQHPMTFAGFASFLQAKMKKVYTDAGCMSVGLELLMLLAISGKLPDGTDAPDHVIIYHPEFLPPEVIATLYIEAHRILRRQIPANGNPALANTVIMDLHDLLGGSYFNYCQTDPMVNGWDGRQKEPGLLGAFGIPAPTGAQCNLKLLTKLERRELEVLTRKAYSIPAPSTTSKQPAPSTSTASIQPAAPAPPASPAASTGSIQSGVPAPAASATSTQSAATGSIKKNPAEARVLDLHRHCIVHLVEDHHVARLSILPPTNQASFSKNPMCWKDGVDLMLHRFGRYPHFVVMSFQMNHIWEMLYLPSRFPIPQVFYSPPFTHVGV